MKTSQRKSKPAARGKSLAFPQALRAFLGHLEGTGKSRHTIASYKSDLLQFDEYWRTGRKRGGAAASATVDRITRKDLERYHEALRLDGQRANTRRRKLMTLRKFLQHLNQRKKVPEDVARKLPAPEKVERVPRTEPTDRLLGAIRGLPADAPLSARNRALLWLLAETGCAVSEACALRFADLDGGGRLSISGRHARTLALSEELAGELRGLRGSRAASALIFQGYNRFAALSVGLTTRGAEMLVKSYRERLGCQDLTPRTFRHSVVVHWYRAGVEPEEIQRRLGLKTAYSFRIYLPIFAGIDERGERA